ncbi:MAG: SusC/RagA family TonB-linked outer membrane protein, partial [Tannerella sp.]|nr:SusC/RagA family TonB-linked outer membrane protein [Tannerella sp.]
YSGLPGFDDPAIYIRGVATLNEGNSSPLILVDGVERPFTQLDPNEVADISILKDAGATAVFGVRGANGVILVTTKRGETGKARITASASYGLQQPTKIVEFADSYLYATTFNNAQLSDGMDPTLLMFKQEALDHYKLGDQPVLYPSIDWMSYVMNKSASQNQVNVNVSGGSERARYFVSISELFQDGLFKTFSAGSRENFKYNRYNYRANLDIDLSKSTLLSVSLGGRIEDRNTMGDNNGENAREGSIFRSMVEAPPMSSAGIVDGKYIIFNRELTPMYIVRDGLSAYYGRGYRNEVTSVLNFDLELKQKLDMITSGLSLKLKGAYNNNFALQKNKTANLSVSPYYPHPVYDADNNLTGYTLEKIDDRHVLTYGESYSYSRDWYFDVSLNYQRQFAEKHTVTALLLYNQTKTYYPREITDIPRGYIGLVARVTYDYQMKYLLDLNMGYNGSENFAPGKRYGFFPSASAGWVITEENFMKEQKILDFLKLRYSFGIVGNDGGVGRFLYYPAAFALNPPLFVPYTDGNYSDMSKGYAFGDRTNPDGYKPNARENSNMGNPDLSWEKARKQNIGFDLRTLNNRLGLNFDYFWEHRWDILVPSSRSGDLYPAQFGLPGSPPLNFDIVDNHGYEVSLSWTDKVGSDFQYTIAPNMSFSRNKLVKYFEVLNEPYLARQGTRVNQPFGLEFFDFYHEGIETEYLAYIKSQPGYQTWLNNQGEGGQQPEYTFPKHFGASLKEGDAVYLDLNYDGVIDGNDNHAIGYPDYPEYSFGLNLNFKYRRFELSMLWIGATNTNRSLGGYQMPFGSQNNGALIKYVAENAWTKDNPDPVFPRITFDNRENNSQNSRIYLIDASYARLKNLELNYDLDVRKVPYINNLRLFFTGYNLLTFTEYKANDPETTGGSFGQFFRYPPTRVYNIGFRLGF